MDEVRGHSPDDLRAALGDLPDRKPTLRLVVALNYAHGVPVADVAEMYGLPERTVYNWLERFEADDLGAAIHDGTRPGRPPRLDADRREALRETLHRPPGEAGVEAPAWTPALVEEHLWAAYGVEYSRRHVRRLMADLGLVRRAADEPGPTGWVPR